MTDMDWVLFDNQSSEKLNQIDTITFAVGLAVSFVNLNGINVLLYGRLYGHVILPVPKAWKILIPLIGLALHAPFFYYIYQADYFHLYMQLAPAGYFSFVLLVLGAIGLKNLRKQNQGIGSLTGGPK